MYELLLQYRKLNFRLSKENKSIFCSPAAMQIPACDKNQLFPFLFEHLLLTVLRFNHVFMQISGVCHVSCLLYKNV